MSLRIVIWFLSASLIHALALSQTSLSADVGVFGVMPEGLSAWASTAPMIDGLLTPSFSLLGMAYPAEWTDARKVNLVLAWGVEVHDASLYVMNDYVNLYIAFEIRFEDYDPADHVWVNFDNDNDNYKMVGDNALYLDANSANVETFAGRYQDGFWQTEGEGYPSSDSLMGGTDDGVGACKFTGATLYSGNYTFEFAYPLNTIDSNHDFSLNVGDTVGFNILYMDNGGGPDSEAGWPTFTKVTWAEMATIRIAGPPLPPPPSVVNLEIDRIEITQAIQWLDDIPEHEDNSLPLAGGKSTIVRVYIKDPGRSVRNVEVCLYASVSGWSRALPGLFGDNGPLHKVFDAPRLPSRADVDDTANFLLPDYWVGDSHVTLTAFCKAPLGQSETDYADNWMEWKDFSFTHTKSWRIGYYLINYRPTAIDPGPNIPSPDKEAVAYQFFEKVTPMPDLSDPIEYVYLGTITYNGPSFTYPNGTFNEENQEVLIEDLNERWRILTESGDFYDAVCGLYGGSANTTIGQANGQNGNWPNVFAAHEDRPWSFAHEIGHNLPTRLPHSWNDSSNPYYGTPREDSCQTYGLDVTQNWLLNEPRDVVKTPEHLLGITRYGALMSYYDRYRWISPYEWEKFMEAFDPPAEDSQVSILGTISSSPGIRVSGVIYPNNTGSLQPIFQTSQLLNYTPPSGPYILELRGPPPAEPLLYSQSFNVSFEADACAEGLPSSLNRALFMFDLPYMTETCSVSLWNSTISPPVLLDKTTASPNSPSVSITHPNGGETMGDSFFVTWTASDPDTGGDPLTFRLFYRHDNATTWKPLSPRITGSNYTVDASRLPGGSQCSIRILASDGFHTSEDQSDAVFSVPLKNPMNLVGNMIGPPERPICFGDPVFLKGSAFDPEDGVLQDSCLSWGSNLSGTLGTGRVLTTTDLLPGLHNVTLIATDSDGNNSTHSFIVNVELHDVAVTNATPTKTIIGEGYNLTTKVAVENLGLSNETVNVTLVMNRINVSTINIGLHGSATEGWGFNPSNMTSPGPTIVVKQWDTVKLTLTSADSLQHNFYVDYNGDTLPTPGEPISPDFTSTINYQFVADTNGIFTYRCQHHTTLMFGTFIAEEPDYLSYYQDAVANEEYLDTASQRISLRNHSTPCLFKGYHVVGVYTGPVPKEIKTTDNLFFSGVVYVGTPGDVDGNHIVNMLDLYRIALNYGKTSPYTTYQVANCDIDDNSIINMLDLYISALHYGQTDP